MPDGKDRARTYEVFPVEYSSWAASEGVPAPPPGARRVSHDTKGKQHGDRLSIVSPNPGDYFKIDPVLRREYQVITIAGFVPRGISDVRLRVNATDELPFDNAGVQWQLQKGVYRFQLCGIAENKMVFSAPVVINVE